MWFRVQSRSPDNAVVLYVCPRKYAKYRLRSRVPTNIKIADQKDRTRVPKDSKTRDCRPAAFPNSYESEDVVKEVSFRVEKVSFVASQAYQWCRVLIGRSMLSTLAIHLGSKNCREYVALHDLSCLG